MAEKVDWNEVFSGDHKTDILFLKKDTKEILKIIGNNVDEKSKEIIEEDGTSVKSISDDEGINAKELGAVISGSKIFLRNKLGSFYDYLEGSKLKNT